MQLFLNCIAYSIKIFGSNMFKMYSPGSHLNTISNEIKSNEWNYAEMGSTEMHGAGQYGNKLSLSLNEDILYKKFLSLYSFTEQINID